MGQIAGGADAETFDEFYRMTRVRVCACIYALTGDLAEAQDATQEAYARAWERWSSISGYLDPEGWVRGVAWRVAANRWRKALNRTIAHRRLGPGDPVPGPSEDAVAIARALKRLPESQRVAIVLHHLVGLSVHQVASETGVAVGTVKARLSRGRAALSSLLRVAIEEPDHA
jgi:RNA polymerase sigma-70 factor (ECF subfamily)